MKESSGSSPVPRVAGTGRHETDALPGGVVVMNHGEKIAGVEDALRGWRKPAEIQGGLSTMPWQQENPPARNGDVIHGQTWRHRHRGETRREVETRLMPDTRQASGG